MMFASKSPRDLNCDPEPFACTSPDFERYRAADDYEGRHAVVHDPRPEFDHAQHNPPNPILVAIRERGTNPAAMLRFIDAILDGAKGDDGVEHARRVLTRLAALTKDNA